MSPARSKRQPVPHRYSRTDIVRAAAVAGGIVVATAILIWLLRPGPAGVPATGGLMNRQPRASWLVGVALGVAGTATWWILRVSRRARARARLLLPIALGVVLAGAIGGGVAWPGGLLRHDVAPPPPATTTTTTTVKGATTTTLAPASTTVGGGTGGTGGTGPAPTSTTTASTTTAATTTTGARTGTS